MFVIFLSVFCGGAVAQSLDGPPKYPEVAWLGRSNYCNPYLGFRFLLPAEFKSEPTYLPVQPHGRHVLLALHLQRLDRSAELLISAFDESSEKSAPLAAKARIQKAHRGGVRSTGPKLILVGGHEFYRLHIANDTGPGNESGYYFAVRGYIVHISIFSHEHDLAATLESAMEHLEFIEPGAAACALPEPKAAGDPTRMDRAPGVLYYGPALPTELVESTVRDAPGYSVPSGEFSRRTFTDSKLGVRVELPQDWQSLPVQDAYRVTELMRDPTVDPELSDRRRVLFRACSRVVFAAANPKVEMIPEVHPAIAVVAMAQGCVPDLVLPATPDDRIAAEEFATVLVRSLGVPLLAHGSSRLSSEGRLTFDLDGTLPYKLPGEKLSRRLGLRVSTTASGPWLIFVYSVTATPAEEHKLESRIVIGIPSAGH